MHERIPYESRQSVVAADPAEQRDRSRQNKDGSQIDHRYAPVDDLANGEDHTDDQDQQSARLTDRSRIPAGKQRRQAADLIHHRRDGALAARHPAESRADDRKRCRRGDHIGRSPHESVEDHRTAKRCRVEDIVSKAAKQQLSKENAEEGRYA